MMDQPLAQQTVERLRQYLAENGFDGQQQRIPSERDLADALGLTRARVRHGLKKLSAEGLVWREGNRGTFVGDRPIPDLAAMSDATSPQEVMEVRIAFEPEMARMAAVRGKRSDFDDIQDCLRRMEEATDYNVFEFWDAKLHRCIAGATQNALIAALFDIILSNRHKQVRDMLRRQLAVANGMKAAIGEHRAIANAIIGRRPDEAADCMRQHLRRIQNTISNDT